MKIVWVTNLMVPEDASLADPAAATFGGWISAMLSNLREAPGLELTVLVRTHSRSVTIAARDGIGHAFVPISPSGGFDPRALRWTLAELAPDLLHIEGAEMVHAAEAAEAFAGPVLVSMQGVMHALARYEFGELPVGRWALGWHRPERALTAMSMLAAKQRSFVPRLGAELRTMARADHVVGRTEWDRAYAGLLAPQAPYTAVPRILRPPFYAPPVPRAGPERHRIFIGNAHQARKGGHVAVKALQLLRHRFADATLVIAGEPPARHRRDWKKRIGYPAELGRQIDAAGLRNSVKYTGVLDAPAMVREMRRSHVFVLASLLENSPNTLAEAMMLGLPVVASYAGGAPDMAQPDVEALFYRPGDAVCLAHQVGRIFADAALAERLGTAAAARARVTHDPAANGSRLLALYRSLGGSDARQSAVPIEAAA